MFVFGDALSVIATGAAVLAALTSAILAVVAVAGMKGAVKQAEDTAKQAEATVLGVQAAMKELDPGSIAKRIDDGMRQIVATMESVGVPVKETADQVVSSLGSMEDLAGADGASRVEPPRRARAVTLQPPEPRIMFQHLGSLATSRRE